MIKLPTFEGQSQSQRTLKIRNQEISSMLMFGFYVNISTLLGQFLSLRLYLLFDHLMHF